MKKIILLTLSFLILGFSKAHAISSMSIINIRDYDGRSPNNFVSEDIYKATHTAVVSTLLAVSTIPCLLDYVMVNQKGVGGITTTVVDIFNARQDTTTTPQITQIARIDTSTNNPTGYFPYHLFLSSGLLINNQGVTAADITIGYQNSRP